MPEYTHIESHASPCPLPRPLPAGASGPSPRQEASTALSRPPRPSRGGTCPAGRHGPPRRLRHTQPAVRAAAAPPRLRGVHHAGCSAGCGQALARGAIGRAAQHRCRRPAGAPAAPSCTTGRLDGSCSRGCCGCGCCCAAAPQGPCGRQGGQGRAGRRHGPPGCVSTSTTSMPQARGGRGRGRGRAGAASCQALEVVSSCCTAEGPQQRPKQRPARHCRWWKQACRCRR